MANGEEGKSVKIEPPASPDQGNQTNQPNVHHVYHDWAAMQAYYGPRYNYPPYYNPAMAPGHAPHPYMWGPPQPMIPPYGPPYAAVYPHGGVYAHPAVAAGPHSHGQGFPASPAAGTPSCMETPSKLSGNADQDLLKKLKGFDGLAMSIGNDNAESAGHGAENKISQSVGAEGLSDGSDGNTPGANRTGRKRSREATPTAADEEEKTEKEDSPLSKEPAASDKMISVTPVSVAGNLAGLEVSSGMTTALELRNPSTVDSKANSSSAPQPFGVLPPEAWLQDERDLKRERRKQSNRESARRSRLRKQAEAEELARKVDSLTAENLSLKSEIKQLAENSEILMAENALLKEKLKNAGQAEEVILNSIDIQRVTPISTENLLSRVNNSSSNDVAAEDENDFGENKSTSGAKLHQLLDNHRANAVAAS
ncbi:hypothetical protein RIF29_16410 [Crotalaria pallida]|uniref:BZIP domain-containing protein n=1 Tax=Crotalaria pallida TaxID=3830 RepID=A0AAN9FNP6_CROPI